MNFSCVQINRVLLKGSLLTLIINILSTFLTYTNRIKKRWLLSIKNGNDEGSDTISLKEWFFSLVIRRVKLKNNVILVQVPRKAFYRTGNLKHTESWLLCKCFFMNTLGCKRLCLKWSWKIVFFERFTVLPATSLLSNVPSVNPKVLQLKINRRTLSN